MTVGETDICHNACAKIFVCTSILINIYLQKPLQNCHPASQSCTLNEIFAFLPCNSLSSYFLDISIILEDATRLITFTNVDAKSTLA